MHKILKKNTSTEKRAKHAFQTKGACNRNLGE